MWGWGESTGGCDYGFEGSLFIRGNADCAKAIGSVPVEQCSAQMRCSILATAHAVKHIM